MKEVVKNHRELSEHRDALNPMEPSLEQVHIAELVTAEEEYQHHHSKRRAYQSDHPKHAVDDRLGTAVIFIFLEKSYLTARRDTREQFEIR